MGKHKEVRVKRDNESTRDNGTNEPLTFNFDGSFQKGEVS
jgi:hypothetical protein